MSSHTDSPEPTRVPLPTGFAPLTPGDPTTIGSFRLVGRLGAGGMGAVYGALDGADRHVAVKVVHPRYAADPVFRTQFAREAELLRRVDAECAPAFFGAAPDDERPWMATEFVPGGTLKEHVRDHGVLTGDQLLSFAAGTAEALAAVHNAGVVHRDVKPANVILSPTGPKVLDFGIARAVDDRASEKGVFGTPGWIAPERLEGGQDSPAVDMFAWGGLVVYAATGHGPFGAGDTATLIARTRTAAPDLEGVPADLLPLVSSALSREPAERPSSEEAFAAVLDLAEAGEPTDGARDRLRELLAGAWTGFAEVRGSGPWIAVVGSVAVLSGSAPLTTTGTSAVATGTSAASAKIGGAGLVAGMSKLTASVVATSTAVAVVTAGWIGGRVYADEPILPFGEESTTTASDPDLEEVEFRGMTLELPEGWTARVVEEEFGGLSRAEDSTVEEWLILHPGGQEGCEEADWTWDYPAEVSRCRHAKVLGPAGIAYGGESWQPISTDAFGGAQGRYAPGTNPWPCPHGAELGELSESDPLEELEHSARDVGEQEASYATGSVLCADGAADSELHVFEQRTWLLDEPQILVVDDYGIGELDAILADATWDLSGVPETQTVEFRGMTLELPAEWEVERTTMTGGHDEGPVITGEAITVTTDPDAICEEPVAWMTCPQILVLGPSGIVGGSEMSPVTEDLYYHPGTGVESCPPDEYLRQRGEVSEEQSLAQVGERSAYYRVWEISCMNLSGEDTELSPGGYPFSVYEQRYWLLPESEILVVDNFTTPGLGAVLARADLPA